MKKKILNQFIKKLSIIFILFQLVLIQSVFADTVVSTDKERHLNPVLSPFNVRMVGVLEMNGVISWDENQVPFSPALYSANRLNFNLDEFALVFDAAYGKTPFGMHFVLPGTEGWGHYQTEYGKAMIGLIRSAYGGRFTDRSEFHLLSVRYRRFRAPGIGFSGDYNIGNIHLDPAIAIMDDDQSRSDFLISGRLGGSLFLSGSMKVSGGVSMMMGEDNRIRAAINSDYKRMDMGADLGFKMNTPGSGLFTYTDIYAEITLGSTKNDNDSLDTTAIWAEAAQGLNVGEGSELFTAVSMFNQEKNKTDSTDLVFGYKQMLTKGVSVDFEYWLAMGKINDKVKGNFAKVRFQFLF